MIKLLADGYTREQFLEVRKNRIGGSDIAAIAGLNSFRSPLQVWAEKTGRAEPCEENIRMWWGTVQEPNVAKLFTKVTGWEVFKVGEVWQHDLMDWAIATPDYQIADHTAEHDEALVEIKTTSINGAKYWSDDAAPDAAAIQLQWQMEIGGIEHGYCCGLIAGDPSNLKTPHMERNRDIGYQLLEQGSKFMDLVRSDTPPGATGKDIELIEKLYPNHNSEEITLGGDAARLFARWDELKTLIKTHETELDMIKARFMTEVGMNGAGVFGDRWVGYAPYKRKASVVAAVDKMIFKVK